MKQISAILLAAGFASRFGSNKLLFPIQGKGLFENILEKVKESQVFSEIIVVTQYEEIEKLAKDCKVIWNAHPEEGIASSLRLGVSAASLSNDLMFFVCDQPYLSVETIQGMTEKFSGGILCAAFGAQQGNPVIFSKKYREELLLLTGDTGGKQIMRRYPQEVEHFIIKERRELLDVDVKKETSN